MNTPQQSFVISVLPYKQLQARYYFYESMFWASEPKPAAKMTWQLMPTTGIHNGLHRPWTLCPRVRCPWLAANAPTRM